MTTGENSDAIALVVPVGSTPDAPLAAIRALRPRHVAFVVSPETRPIVDQIEAQQDERMTRNRVLQIPDAQDLNGAFRAIHSQLPAIIQEWGLNWDAVCIDLTGGTKVMTAALALATIHHARRYIYIGGTERTKDGIGTVVSGKELAQSSVNPWDELAVDQLRRIAWAFNNCQFAAAKDLAERTLCAVDNQSLKGYLGALVKLISGYQAWDRFAYKQACDDIGKASRTLGLAWESRQGYQHLTAQLRDQENVLNSISRSLRNEAPSLDLLKDLLANARRRAVMEQRHDDSVARLYRFFEGLAQSVLWERHELRTAAIPAERLPKNEEWERVRQRAKDTLAKLGLEDSYRLLLDLNDPLGKAFPRIARGGDIHKMLQERNSSLMAHGVQAVGTKVFNGMFQACLDLAGWSESDLTAFIRLPED